MIAKRCLLPLFILALLVSPKANGQSEANDTSFYNNSINNLISFYKNKVGANLSLYNGSEYVRKGSGAKGIPFFETDSFINGSIVYEGKLYTDIEMQYDLFQDAVVIKDYIQALPIKLVTNKISSFSIWNHTFVSYGIKENNAAIMPLGFYDQLHLGKVALYARREKKIQNTRNEDNGSSFVQYNTYYLFKDNAYHIINNEKNLLDLLADKKGQLNNYIKSNKAAFKKNQEDAFIKIAEYYTQLKS